MVGEESSPLSVAMERVSFLEAMVRDLARRVDVLAHEDLSEKQKKEIQSLLDEEAHDEYQARGGRLVEPSYGAEYEPLRLPRVVSRLSLEVIRMLRGGTLSSTRADDLETLALNAGLLCQRFDDERERRTEDE